MMDFNIGALMLGLIAGFAVSTLFFAGLAFGMRIALGAARPAAVLLLSAGLRIALLIGIGLVVANMGLWALAGYAGAFLIVRFAALAITRFETTKASKK